MTSRLEQAAASATGLRDCRPAPSPPTPLERPGFALEKDLRSPYTERWSFGFQRQLSGKIAARWLLCRLGEPQADDLGRFQSAAAERRASVSRIGTTMGSHQPGQFVLPCAAMARGPPLRARVSVDGVLYLVAESRQHQRRSRLPEHPIQHQPTDVDSGRAGRDETRSGPKRFSPRPAAQPSSTYGMFPGPPGASGSTRWAGGRLRASHRFSPEPRSPFRTASTATTTQYRDRPSRHRQPDRSSVQPRSRGTAWPAGAQLAIAIRTRTLASRPPTCTGSRRRWDCPTRPPWAATRSRPAAPTTST